MNSEPFAVGEIAIIARSDLADYPVGMEVEILAIFGAPGSDEEYQIAERIEGCVLFVICAGRADLRKKRPPKDESLQIVSWDRGIWAPELAEA